jgi:hypothetical protein
MVLQRYVTRLCSAPGAGALAHVIVDSNQLSFATG